MTDGLTLMINDNLFKHNNILCSECIFYVTNGVYNVTFGNVSLIENSRSEVEIATYYQ